MVTCDQVIVYRRALYFGLNDIPLLVVIHQLIDWHTVVFVFAFAVDLVVEGAVAAIQFFSLAAFA